MPLDIVEVDAAQTARQLQSADAAVINNDFVVEAGIDPSKAIFIEPKGDNAKQWYNLIAAKKDWKKAKNADAIQKVVDAYHTDEVKKVIKESSEGLDEPV
ncbi:Methionine ABC transporter substrate-binding protein [Streptococcus acidominimus]|uniref:Methionine ABC transporter substrate-binding protein n=1 Tax=Streptococcus acidominimus TaxID=1326 RepID=A0A239X3G4_STRAI|nr:Methionine ABC transporter substrate-binding protein [Streptococcus acidominimus]